MTATQQAKPWDRYEKDSSGPGQAQLQWKLLQPGWGGELTEGEIQFILSKLLVDPTLAYWWGFRPGTKRRPVDAIKAVAMQGNPEVRGDNVKLVRKHRTPAAKQMPLPWG